jgi:hypothetical protein
MERKKRKMTVFLFIYQNWDKNTKKRPRLSGVKRILKDYNKKSQGFVEFESLEKKGFEIRRKKWRGEKKAWFLCQFLLEFLWLRGENRFHHN